MLVLIVLIEAAVIIPSFFILPRNGFLAAVLPEALTNLANKGREQAGLPALQTNPLLAQAAEAEAQGLIKQSYFSDNTPKSDMLWLSLARVGYTYHRAGVALGVGFFDSRDLALAWQHTPAEGALRNSAFSEIGVGVAAGNYQGRNSLYVVEFFGEPASPAGGPVAPSAVDASRPNPLHRVLSTWEILATELHTISSRVFLGLLYLTILVFLLNVLVAFRIQHPHIIMNGFLLILVLVGILYLNNQLFHGKLRADYREIISPAAN